MRGAATFFVYFKEPAVIIPSMVALEVLQSVTLPPAERDAVVASADRCEDFMICGRRFRLCANDSVSIEGFRRTFEDFRCLPDPAAAADMTLYCHRRGDPVPTATFAVWDRGYRTTDPGLVADPFPVLDHLLIAHMRTHYIIHAGCVSRRDRGIIISGSSHMGKTTLTTFLVSRGMGFLSDEIAPIARADGRVAPFPLHLGIRAGPAATLVDALPGTAFECGEDRKKLVNARHLNRSVVQNPVPLHAVVFLTSRMSSEVSTARKFEGFARVTFAAMDAAFRRAILDQTRSDLVGEESPAPSLFSLLLQSREPAGFLDAVRRTAEQYGIPIVFIEYEDLDARDFSADPRLMKLPAAAGVMELAKKMPASQKAELVRTQFGGRMPPMIEELSRAVRDVGFYKLSPGRLEAMIQAIETLP